MKELIEELKQIRQEKRQRLKDFKNVLEQYIINREVIKEEAEKMIELDKDLIQFLGEGCARLQKLLGLNNEKISE